MKLYPPISGKAYSDFLNKFKPLINYYIEIFNDFKMDTDCKHKSKYDLQGYDIDLCKLCGIIISNNVCQVK